MERIEELCCYYISFLRSLKLLHKNNHWISAGKNFYGNHLLFDRIAESAEENADTAAEKFVGIFNEDCLDLNLQAKIMAKMLDKFSSEKLLKSSLMAEQEFLEFNQHFYDALKKQDVITLGLEDSLSAIASSREEAVYLLKQASEEENLSINPVQARINLFKKLQKSAKK